MSKDDYGIWYSSLTEEQRAAILKREQLATNVATAACACLGCTRKPKHGECECGMNCNCKCKLGPI